MLLLISILTWRTVGYPVRPSVRPSVHSGFAVAHTSKWYPRATAKPELQAQPNNDEPCCPIVPVLDENALDKNVKERDAGGGLSALVPFLIFNVLLQIKNMQRSFPLFTN